MARPFPCDRIVLLGKMWLENGIKQSKGWIPGYFAGLSTATLWLSAKCISELCTLTTYDAARSYTLAILTHLKIDDLQPVN